VASLSLAICFRRLGVAMATSLVGGLLFLINIAHVGTVHWISALEYPMAVLNSAWTLYFFARYIESGRRMYYGFFFAGLTLCILTHFVTVLLWPLCLFYAWFNSANFRGIVRSLLFLLPALALALVLVFATTGSDTTTQSAFDFYSHSTSQLASLLTFAFDGARAYLWLLGRLISMAHWLPFAPNEENPAEIWLGGLALVALLVLLWKRNPSIQFWCAWTLLFLVPFVPATLVHTGIARYIYIATAGSSLLLAWVLTWLADRLGRTGPYVLALTLLLIVWSSYRAEEQMANLTRYNSGRYYITNDDPQIGIELLQKALATDPAFLPLGEAYLSWLQGLLILGQDYEELLKVALEEAPEDHNIQLLKRISNVVMDSADRAADPEVLAVLYGANYTHVDSAFLHTTSILSQHFGNWYSKRGDSDGAIRSYRLSLRADPQNLNTTQSLIN
jgi:tetratricopeptide (TPR) repeat protein